MSRTGSKWSFASVVLIGTAVCTALIFAVPLLLYQAHRAEVVESSLLAQCPASATAAGCFICAHPGSAAPAALQKVTTEQASPGRVNAVYHHKALWQFMYQFGLSSVVDVGCGIAPAFIMQLRAEIPCFGYAGTENRLNSGELRTFQNMFEARLAKGPGKRKGGKVRASWADFRLADVASQEAARSELPLGKDAVYYHRPLDLDSPEMRARVVASLCRARPRYIVLKDGSRKDGMMREPDAFVRERNLRGLDRYFLLHDANALCYSVEFGKFLEGIPRSTRKTSPMVGMYTDDAHPGFIRHVTSSSVGDILLVSGLDGGAWVLPGWVTAIGGGDSTLTVDFSHKGGPVRLRGIYDSTTDAIRWTDGNVWHKKA